MAQWQRIHLPMQEMWVGLIPRSGRCPREENGNPLQYSCLGNPMDRGAWQATVHGVTKSQTVPSDWTAIHIYLCMCAGTHTHTHTHTQIYTQTHTAELGALLKEHRGQNQSSRGPDRAPAQPHTAARVQAHRSRQVDSAGAGFYRWLRKWEKGPRFRKKRTDNIRVAGNTGKEVGLRIPGGWGISEAQEQKD